VLSLVRRPLFLHLVLVLANLAVGSVAQTQQDTFAAGKACFFLTVHIGGGAGMVAVGGGV